MAELVQRHMESMAEEIEEMRRTKLYTFDETRLILQKRKEFEYKINGILKTLKDFKDYIMYEKVLLRHIQNRRNKNKIAGNESGIEHKIMRRIKNLYEIALQRFSNDFELGLSYFKFCKQSNYINAASTAVENMIKNYSQNPEVWQIAAGWYAYERKDVNSALKILRKGLTLHKSNPKLYTEAIKMELSSPVTEEQETVLCEKLKTYIDLICENITDFHYFIELLNLLEKYTFTQSTQNILIEKLLKTFKNEELVWHTLAQREKRGVHYNLDENGDDSLNKTSLSLCFEKYEKGLQSISIDDKKKQLLFMYLDYLIELWRENNDSTVCSKLKVVLEEAYSEGSLLIEKYYVAWLELVDDDEAAKIIEKGITLLPDSVHLWKLRLHCAISKDSIREVNEVFKLGVIALKNESLPLWLMLIQYHSLISSDAKIESIYLDGIEQPMEISQVFKPKYVEWLALNQGIKKAREVYQRIANIQPYCKELHLIMNKLESTEINLDLWVKVHELACKQFGHEDVDVWINHILFYLKFNTKQIQNVEKIYKEAENTLPDLLLSDFKEKYSNVLNEFK